MRQSKLDIETQQIFNAEVDAAIRESIANILWQLLTSNEVIESAISEKIKELQNEQNRLSTAKVEPKIDHYLHNENYDDENVSGKQHLPPSKGHYMLNAKERKLCKYERIASWKKKQNENGHIELTWFMTKNSLLLKRMDKIKQIKLHKIKLHKNWSWYCCKVWII